MLLSSIHSEKVLSHGTDLKGLFIKKIHSFFFLNRLMIFSFSFILTTQNLILCTTWLTYRHQRVVFYLFFS